MQNVQKGTVSGVYLMEGTEENLKSDTLAKLRKAILPEGLEQLNEAVMENPAAADIMAAAETMPFMSDKRLVIVRELACLTGRSEV